ncbi:sensor histidine kinase [Nocardiopsis alkaliphila]|uniref:sensor histidine kinase n=1 Tax=Nocardiopsis alkaliphila TaxID=225762 RepID=UPI0003648A2A|nr:sensor histidine kinase [Nocardiopsis alkaliphila]
MGNVLRRSWRALLYLWAVFVSGLVTLVMIPLTLVVALITVIGGTGPLSLWSRSLVGWASRQRGRAGRLLGIEVAEPAEPVTGRLRDVWSAPSTRRTLTWTPVFTAVSVPAGLVGLMVPGFLLGLPQSLLWWAFPVAYRPTPFGLPIDSWGSAFLHVPAQLVLAVVIAIWVAPFLARAHARLSIRLLAPSTTEVLTERVDELRRTRADVVDTHGAELRRIERDLHDGTQARLVAIAMRLGVAREAVSDPQVADLLGRAHEDTEEAMAELREVIRSVYPPILADRGLPGALTALAARTTARVDLDVAEPGVLPVAVETAAYYVVTEAVANAVRHGGAETISVRLAREEDLLRVRVTDDGRGGVDESNGSGIRGLRRRVAALDGRVRVDGPEGGPTVIEVELPCGS